MPRTPEDERPLDLNMTPMIDVVFQLLIFFMLSMHFREVEGKLITTLPPDKGLPDRRVSKPELHEVRVVLRGRGACRALVEKIDCGELAATEGDNEAAPRNKSVYRGIGAKAKELYDMTPSSRDPSRPAPVIVDADGEVPYEHVVGVVNALQERGIHNIEFAGNARFSRYYGDK